MLKRLAIVVLLAIVLPVDGQEKGSQARGGKSDSNSAQNPTAVPSGTATCVVKEEGTTIECRWPKGEPESKFSRLFSPENAPNIGLFFVGLVGVLAAVFTLLAIKRQADSMEKQATHMESQITEAKAQVALLAQQNKNARDRERARLIVRQLETPELFPTNPTTVDRERALKVRVFVENLGGSRAFNVRAWGIVNIVSDRMGDNYDVGVRQIFPSIIDADQQKHPLNVTGFGREFEGIATTGDYTTITEDLARRLRDGEVFVATSGTFVYEDIYDDTYETPFLFVWRSFGNDDGRVWLTDSYWLDCSPRSRRIHGDKTPEDKGQNPN